MFALAHRRTWYSVFPSEYGVCGPILCFPCLLKAAQASRDLKTYWSQLNDREEVVLGQCREVQAPEIYARYPDRLTIPLQGHLKFEASVCPETLKSAYRNQFRIASALSSPRCLPLACREIFVRLQSGCVCCEVFEACRGSVASQSSPYCFLLSKSRNSQPAWNRKALIH